MSVLDEIRSAITEVFSDPELFFSQGTITRVSTIRGGGYIEPVTDKKPLTCMMLLEHYDDKVRAEAGIPDTDVKFIILQQTLSTELQKGDVINHPGNLETESIPGDYRVINITMDPAEATYIAQARPV